MGWEPFGFGDSRYIMDQMGWAVLARSCTAQNKAASEPLDR
jgi:hypothetical protein